MVLEGMQNHNIPSKYFFPEEDLWTTSKRFQYRCQFWGKALQSIVPFSKVIASQERNVRIFSFLPLKGSGCPICRRYTEFPNPLQETFFFLVVV